MFTITLIYISCHSKKRFDLILKNIYNALSKYNGRNTIMKKLIMALGLMCSLCNFAQAKDDYRDNPEVMAMVDYFNHAKIASGFISTDPHGNKAYGYFYFIPGHLKLKYENPGNITIVGDSSKIVLHNSNNGANTSMNIKKQPLGLLLKNHVALTDRVMVTSVQHGQNTVQISLADADNPSQGLLTIAFTNFNGQLRLYSMNMIDAARNNTHIDFGLIKDVDYIDPESFSIN